MAAAQSGKRKFWIFGFLGLIAAFGLAGAASWYFLNHGGANADAATRTSVTGTSRASAKPLFFHLEPFTVNLKSSAYGDRLLYVGITLEIADDAVRQRIQAYLPQVRNRLLMVLSGQDADTLISGDGKQKLAQRIRTALNESTQDPPEMRVDGVLFTQFIVQ